MRQIIASLFLLIFAGIAMSDNSTNLNAYKFSFISIDGRNLHLSQFEGKVLLVINTASRCGFTGQYSEIQKLWATYRDKGLVIIGVPSNDFGGQEPKGEEEIQEFCKVNFGVDFFMTTKEHVTGDQAHPFYKWVSKETGLLGKPRWNFHKYLIGPDGQVVDWFSSPTSPTSKQVIKAIEEALSGDS